MDMPGLCGTFDWLFNYLSKDTASIIWLLLEDSPHLTEEATVEKSSDMNFIFYLFIYFFLFLGNFQFPFLVVSWAVMICSHVGRRLEKTDDLSECVIQSEPWGTGVRRERE